MYQIKDRLNDLKKKTEQLEIVSKGEEIEEIHEIEEIDEKENEINYKIYNGPIGNLLKKYLYIRILLGVIENRLDSMKSMTLAANINDFNQKDFDKIRCESLKIGNNIIKKFKKLESNLSPADDFTTFARMKRWLYFGFFQQYIVLWSKNEQFLMDLEQKARKKLQIQSQILNCNLSDEDIDNLIENKNTNLFMSNILQNTEAERQKLQEIQDRFEDLKKLEKSITEVHNLFTSLQTIVAEQGDIIQSIEYHFNVAQDHIQEATEQINAAVQLMTKYRFKCCWCCCC